MATPSGLDQSWGYADPKAAAAAGVKVVSMYLSWDTSKNITKADVRSYHQVGIGLILNWESQAGAPRKGAAQGKADATEAVRQAKALIAAVATVPENRLVIYFSCDTDVSATDWPKIDAYYRAAKTICAAGGFGVGVYGEADLVTHLANAGITDAEWQTYAWSRGVLAPAADFYQYLNGQKLGGASVDFDRIIHPAELGAWWPTGHTYDAGDDPMAELTEAQLDQIAAAVWERPMHYGVADPHTGKKPTMQASTMLLSAYVRAGIAANPAALATAIVAKLPAGSVSAAQIEDAVKSALSGATIEVAP